MKVFYISLSFLILLSIFSCDDSSKAEAIKTSNPGDTIINKNNKGNYDDVVGFAGIYDVPEMLCLSKMDSAKAKDIARKVMEDYLILEREIQRTGAIPDGPAGQINYNNDPNNFKFECIRLIKEIPSKEPRDCNIVVLEASKMVIYNYYGHYNELYKAYAEIGNYCKKHNLVQSGPQREFYITDPEAEKDPSKWLTRIMLPVFSEKK
jgi:effector-binding domain-containing protein